MNKARVIASYLRGLYESRWRDRGSLERWQEARMQAHLRQVLPLSPYYRARVDPARWREAPLTDKALMMAHFDALNTVGLQRGEALAVALRAERERDWSAEINGVAVGLSSGSSGHRGLFLATAAEREAWAGRMLAKALPGPLWQGQRIALFLRSNSRLYESLGSGRLRFAYFDTQEELRQQLARLRDFDPTVLCAPPSLLRQLAPLDHGLRLRRLYAAAEPLEALDLVQLQSAFGVPVQQIYQATEGFIAITCSHGTLHVNEDVMVMQKDWLDEAQTRFSPVLSDFRRRSQPILRYRLDDVCTLRTSPCPCGSIFTALGAIEGRQDDLCYFPRLKGRALRPVYADFLRQALLLVDGITDYRVEQLSPQRLRLAVACAKGQRPRVLKAVRRELTALAQRQGFVAPTLRFDGHFHALGTAKLRRIRRLFPVPR